MKQRPTSLKALNSAVDTALAEGEEQRHRMTLEALADVDSGHLINHAVVQAWAAGLLRT